MGRTPWCASTTLKIVSIHSVNCALIVLGLPTGWSFICLDTQLMNIFRGVVQKGELSERVLDLTAEILGINPGSYTVWFV